MSSLRSVALHRCKVARVKSRAARTELALVPSVRVAIRGRRPRPAAGSGGDHPLVLASPALSAATISHRQPAPPSMGGVCAATGPGSSRLRSRVLIVATACLPLARCQADRGDLGRGQCREIASAGRRPGACATQRAWPERLNELPVPFLCRQRDQCPLGRRDHPCFRRPRAAAASSRRAAAAAIKAVKVTAVSRSCSVTGCVAQNRPSVCWHRGSQPAERIDPPPGSDRTGPDVSLAERGGIEVPGNARTHLAPHDRYPQLVADHRPPGNPCAGTGLRAGHGLGAGHDLGTGHRRGPGAGLDAGAGLRAGHGLGGGNGLNRGDGPVRRICARFCPGASGADRPGVAARGRPGAGVVAQFGEPVAHLEQAGFIWPDTGLHVQALPSARGERRPAASTCRKGEHADRDQARPPSSLRRRLRRGRLRSMPGSCPARRDTRPAAGGRRALLHVPAVALAHPRKGPGSPVSGLPRSHGCDPRSQADEFMIKVRPIYEPLRRVMWTTLAFPLCTGCKWRSHR